MPAQQLTSYGDAPTLPPPREPDVVCVVGLLFGLMLLGLIALTIATKKQEKCHVPHGVVKTFSRVVLYSSIRLDLLARRNLFHVF
jgi:hypothetical protein